MDRATPVVPVAPPSREAEIAARLANVAQIYPHHKAAADLRYLLAHLQQAHDVIVGWTETHAASSKLWRERLAASEAHLQQAREALAKYGDHFIDCKRHDGEEYICTCGLDAALQDEGR